MKNWAHGGIPASILAASLVALTGCGGGGSGAGTPSNQMQKYTIGGTIEGSSGVSGIVLANGADTLTIDPNASNFTMPTAVVSGTGYDVTVQTAPLALDCTVLNGVGTVSAADITTITVSCLPATVSVLYSFAGGANDGSRPDVGVIQASDGDFYGMTTQGGASNDGIVFEMGPEGTETVLHSFAGGATDGASPYGGLIQASDGDFYGMTFQGGANNYGVIFKIAANGTETVVHSFSGGAGDGANPYGSLIQASDGNFYGTTAGGGTGGEVGVVFKMTPSGAVSVLYSFNYGTTDGYYPEGNLIQASDGNFYGLTSQGGSSNDGIVFKISPGGAETVLHSFGGGTADGALPFGTLIQASDGNLYGETSQGGASNVGVIFRITPSGTETVLHSFAGASDGASPYYGNLIQASDGNLYGTAWEGGQNYVGTLFMISLDGAEFVFHTFARVTTDGAYPGGNLIQAQDGMLYGVTALGGANSDGTVFEVH